MEFRTRLATGNSVLTTTTFPSRCVRGLSADQLLDLTIFMSGISPEGNHQRNKQSLVIAGHACNPHPQKTEPRGVTSKLPACLDYIVRSCQKYSFRKKEGMGEQWEGGRRGMKRRGEDLHSCTYPDSIS